MQAVVRALRTCPSAGYVTVGGLTWALRHLQTSLLQWMGALAPVFDSKQRPDRTEGLVVARILITKLCLSVSFELCVPQGPACAVLGWLDDCILSHVTLRRVPS
jgi:hypothetical protein